LVQCRLVTDRLTDRQTDGHTTTASTALALRRAGKNLICPCVSAFLSSLCAAAV